MNMTIKRKKPTDYPQFTFRLDAKTKDKLTREVEEVTQILNSKLTDDNYMLRKNDIVIEALNIGLATLKKRGKIK